MEHRGEILERIIREKGFPITFLAKRLNKSRQYVYNLFSNPEINPDILLDIGNIINHDFSKEISFFLKVEESQEVYITKKNTSEYWKEKYFELLEKYNFLLEQQSKK